MLTIMLDVGTSAVPYGDVPFDVVANRLRSIELVRDTMLDVEEHDDNGEVYDSGTIKNDDGETVGHFVFC